ncbi:MAG: hypothetical protein AMXMBFR83_23430 [Phycisphaerae bacterium]
MDTLYQLLTSAGLAYLGFVVIVVALLAVVDGRLRRSRLRCRLPAWGWALCGGVLAAGFAVVKLVERDDWLQNVVWHRTAVMAWFGVFELVLISTFSLIAILKAQVTERIRVEEQFRDYRRDLEEQAKARSEELLEAQRQVMQSETLASLGQLAAGVAHEINTPIQFVGDNLRAISDFLDELVSLTDQYRELIAQIPAEGPIQKAIEQVRQAEAACDLEYIRDDAPKAVTQGLEGVQRVAHIVRAMKDFSHVDRGQISLVDVNRSLETTLTVARNEYKYVADIQQDFAPDLPQIEAYGGELNQVFLNILVNAAHAIGDTGKRGVIALRTRCLGDQVEVSISDTGTGIPEAVRNKVFDPFFTTKPVGKGTGQGLNIAHQIVVGKHGGALTFESQMGKGTTFFIRLPVKLAAPAEGTEPPRSEEGTNSAVPALAECVPAAAG